MRRTIVFGGARGSRNESAVLQCESVKGCVWCVRIERITYVEPSIATAHMTLARAHGHVISVQTKITITDTLSKLSSLRPDHHHSYFEQTLSFAEIACALDDVRNGAKVTTDVLNASKC